MKVTNDTKNKGITLIALIITIIVMLILVAVTINMAINGGLFEKAGEAVGETENAVNKEKDLANGGITIGGTYYNSIDEYLNGGTTLISLYKSGKLKVGDYVGYNPSTASAVNPDDPEGTGTVAAGTLTGYTDATQSVEQETLKWRVLGADGDNLLLISATPTMANGAISFYGHVGYNNYENVLNTTCNKLYSNSSIGATARSITMSDIDTYLGGNAYDKTTFGGGSSEEGGYGHNNKNVLSRFKIDSSGNLERVSEPTGVSYNSMNMPGRLKTLKGDEKPTFQLLVYDSTEFTTLDLTSTAYAYTASDVITDATKLNLLEGSNASSPYYYWVASRSVIVDSSGAGWCVGNVGGGGVIARSYLCDSDGNEGGIMLCVRPIVSLSSKVTTEQVPIIETAPTITWDDPLGQYVGNPT